MADEPDPDRLRALEARLDRMKEPPPPEKGEAGKAFSQGELAWRMVIELVTGMFLGLLIGFGLDFLFKTRPIFLVIFALLGFAAGVRTMMGTARQMAQAQEEKAGLAAPDRRG